MEIRAQPNESGQAARVDLIVRQVFRRLHADEKTACAALTSRRVLKYANAEPIIIDSYDMRA